MLISLATYLDLTRYPPVFWAEVYSRSEQKWIPVDPVRGVIKRKKDFEPSSESGPIRMLYVVAFEEGEVTSVLNGNTMYTHRPNLQMATRVKLRSGTLVTLQRRR